jgi:hypothetical protein
VGLIDGRSVNRSGTVRLAQGDTAGIFFRRADKELNLAKEKPFRRAFRQGVRPTVLINGDRLEMPEEKNRILRDGDEISVLLAVGGG